ncbi:MAG TPA: hypothetical protein ENH82_12305 [bacterium]|nr:hypothetical protein [bacterium]
MIDTKLIDHIQDKRRRIADRILLIQAPLLFFLIVAITKTIVVPKTILDFLLLYWFYWIFLKGYRLSQDISKINSAIDADITTNNYNSWAHFKEKSIKIYKSISIVLVAFVIISMIFKIPIGVFKNIFLSILFLDITVFAIQRIIAVREYVKSILRMHAEESEVELNKQHDLIPLENRLRR